MEKKKSNDKRSRSARCAGKRTMRFCFAVMTIVMLVCSMVAPASALMLDNDVNEAGTLLKGVVTLHLTNTPDEVSSELMVQYPVGGIVPWIVNAGTNTGVESSTLTLPLDNSFYYTQQLALARRDFQLALAPSVFYQFDSYRYNYQHTLTANGETNKAYYTIAKYEFDPAYLRVFTRTMLENLITFRFKQDFSLVTSITYSWLGLDNLIHTDTSIHAVNILPNDGETIVYSGIVGQCINDIIADVGDDPAGAGLYIEDLTVSVTPGYGTSASGIVFDMLTDVWTTNVPQFYSRNPSAVWFDEVERFMEQNSGGSGGGSGGGLPEYPSVEEGPFMQFVVSSVASFFDAEIMPGFSLGGVFSVVFMIVVIILILKFFAGG